MGSECCHTCFSYASFASRTHVAVRAFCERPRQSHCPSLKPVPHAAEVRVPQRGLAHQLLLQLHCHCCWTAATVQQLAATSILIQAASCLIPALQQPWLAQFQEVANLLLAALSNVLFSGCLGADIAGKLAFCNQPVACWPLPAV